jgi:cytochrome c biogenesis protein CcmG/thiol:disulfide interchange protein DsbE
MHQVKPCHSVLALLFICLTVALPASSNAAVPTFDQQARAVVAALPTVKDAIGTSPDALDNQPIIVTFFASWCPPCREEFAHLNKLADKYRDTDLRIIAINVYEAWDDNDAARMQQFIRATAPQFPALVGSESVRDLFGGISRIPTVYGFSRDGKLSYRFIHKRGAKKTNATFAELDSAAQLLLQ